MSVAFDEAEGTGGSGTATGWSSVSADGRFVAFGSDFTNLVADDTNGELDIFVHDRLEGTTQRVSVASDGAEANAGSFVPWIDTSGRFVAFYSLASNLVSDDANDALDVFVHDRQTGVTERVSIGAEGTESNGDSIHPVLSADGRFVAFESDASNVVPGDTNNARDVFVHDRQTGATERVSVASDGSEHDGGPFTGGAHISADGRTVVFYSDGTNLVTGDSNLAVDVFVHDRQNDTTERVSIASDGAEADSFSRAASISADGGFVAFSSIASNLDEDAPSPIGFEHIYVHDRQKGVTERVSIAADGTLGNGFSDGTAISADGRYVAFISFSSNLVPDDNNGTRDAFVYDREIGSVTRVSVAFDCAEGDGQVFQTLGRVVGMTPDGRLVTYGSMATNLVPGDTNGAVDVFVHALPALAITPDPLDFGHVLVGDMRGPLGVILSNASLDDLTISEVSDPEAPFTAAGGTCGAIPFTLAPGELCEMNFSFSPAVSGPASSTVTLTSDAPGGLHTISLRGIGSADPLVITPAGLDFGGVVVDETGGPLGVTLTNAATATLEVSAVSAPATPFFAAGGTCGEIPFSLDPFASCTLDYTFGPPETGDFNEVVLVTHDASGSPGSFSLQGHGVQRELTVTPNLLEFGAAPVGETVGPLSVTLTNTGDVDVFLFSVSDPGAPFALLEDTCADIFFFILPSGASCSLAYAFSPTAPGDVSASVTIDSNAPSSPNTVTLQGTGLSDAELTFDPASLDFGDVDVGTTSAARTAMLHNAGDVDATGITFTLPGGTFDADTSACDDTLAPGASCAVDVAFAPADEGPATASLEVTSDGGAAASLALVGSGVGEPAFTPVALEVDPEPFLSDGNGVFEPDERIEVMPTWRNDGNLAASLAGTATDFDGMDGAIYALAADEADYGVVEPATEASCRDLGICYGLAVNDPAIRPAKHWMAHFDETLSDGTTKTWSLHIGGSFVDVPQSSPFYTATETLLHHGVTGGCADTEYCPAGNNTRGQMAVFLLKAVEGADYVPSACDADGERFDDVPSDSPLCPWIEDLAARGVTAGCGGGNYCPGSAVTRAQMAVFLLKAFEGDGYTPPDCSGEFTDVACPSTFAAWIGDLASRGITSGCDGDNYCPGEEVTRAQMAVFVTKTFGLTLYGP